MSLPKTWKQISVGELARINNQDDVFVVVRQHELHAEILQITGKNIGMFLVKLNTEYAWPIKIRQVVTDKSTKGFFKIVQRMVHDMEEK
jgi:hypothetical protein